MRSVDFHRYWCAVSHGREQFEHSTTLLVGVVCLSFWNRHLSFPSTDCLVRRCDLHRGPSNF